MIARARNDWNDDAAVAGARMLRVPRRVTTARRPTPTRRLTPPPPAPAPRTSIGFWTALHALLAGSVGR